MGPSDPLGGDDGAPTRQRSTYLTDRNAATVCTIFADGLESGMSYARIIDMLERQGHDKKLVASLREAILEQGRTLSTALAINGILDDTARTLVAVAERQGKLPTTFRDLASYYTQRHKRRSQLVSSLVEPCILFALGMILARNLFSADLLAIVQSSSVWAALAPIFIQSLIEIGIFGCVVFLVGLTYLNLPVEMASRRVFQRFWLALPLPLINTAARKYATAAFFHYLQQSIASGLTVHQGLALAAKASHYPSLEHRVSNVQRAIEEGQMLAAAMRTARLVEEEAISFIEVGEETGHLEERLDELADRYTERAQAAFENTMKAIVYLLRFFVIVVVVILLGMTIYDMMGDSL